MKISTKGRYGLRALLDLAINSIGDHVSLKNIAERQDISESYLEQVFSTLRKAGLVNSIKGAQGGYVLSKSPSEITIGEILRALEGELSVADSKLKAGDEENIFLRCINEKVWKVMDSTINSVIDGVTLDNLISEYIRLNDTGNYMYYI